jgi:hypothetical protein
MPLLRDLSTPQTPTLAPVACFLEIEISALGVRSFPDRHTFRHGAHRSGNPDATSFRPHGDLE